MAELPVVHVHGPLPGDLLGVDAQAVPLLDVVVQHGRQQVVGRADGVEVAGEVEVDVLHGHHLGVAAPGRASLDAEDGAQTGLPEGHHGVPAQPAEAVRKAHAGGGLPLPGGGGGDGGDQDQLPVGPVRKVPQQGEVDLRLVAAVQLQIFLVDAGESGDVRDLPLFAGLGDLDVGLRCHDGILRSGRKARRL